MTWTRAIVTSALLLLGALPSCAAKPPEPAGGAVADTGAATPMASHAAAPVAAPATAPHPPPATAAPQVTERIPPAPGGTAVADVWATRQALAGKAVTVRGKIVKFNGGILGVNWLHIQDGSGSAKDGTNDLTITCDAAAKVGDVVTATGTVAIDKDFGAGYAYPVILEKATVVVK